MTTNYRLLPQITPSLLLPAVLVLFLAWPAVAVDKLSLEQCLQIAHKGNLQRMSDLQDL